MQTDICMQAKLSQIHSNAIVEDLQTVDNERVLDSVRREIIDSIRTNNERCRSNDRYVWFTFRKDEVGDVFLGWPVSGYMPVKSADIHRDIEVIRAGSRLKRRDHIRSITVTGPIRNYTSYFSWVQGA